MIVLLRRILKLDESSNFFALSESESFSEILQNVLQVNLYSRVEKTETTSAETSTSDLQQVNDAAVQAVVENANSQTQTSITTKVVKVISKDKSSTTLSSSSQNDEFLKTLPLKSAVEMELNSLFNSNTNNKARSKAIKDYSQKTSTSTLPNTSQKIKEELKNSFTPIPREPSIQCPFCVPEDDDDDSFPSPQKFAKTKAYMSHYIAKHAKVNENTGKPIFWCSVCDKVFRSRDCFVAHVKESICFNGNEKAVRRFPCPHCLNSFKRATHLYEHVMSVHKHLVDNEGEEEEVTSLDEEDNEHDYHQRPSTSKGSASKKASRRPKVTSFSDDSSSSDVVFSPLKGERKRTSNTKSLSTKTKKSRRLTLSDLDDDDDALENLMNVETTLDCPSSSASPASESPQTPVTVEVSSNAGSSTIEVRDEEVNKEKAEEDFPVDFKEEFDEEIEIVNSPSNPSYQPSQETSTSTSTQLKKKPNRYKVKFVHTSIDAQEQTENLVDGAVVDVLTGRKRSLPSKKKASKKD